MQIAKTSRTLGFVNNWEDLPYGKSTFIQTQSHIDRNLELCFGTHLLKLGNLSCKINTDNSSIKHHINCSKISKDADLHADLQQLPLRGSSIDLCILAHELDFSNDPHQLLREIERILALDGTLIISGYHPFSWVRLTSFFKSKKNYKARLFFPSRVIDWLQLLGFEIYSKQYFDFISSNSRNGALLFIKKHAQNYAPFLFNVYFIVAKKRSTPMTPIKSTFRFRPVVLSHSVVANHCDNNRERGEE